MKDWYKLRQIMAAVVLLIAMGACAYPPGPGPYYSTSQPPSAPLPPPAETYPDLRVGYDDQNFVMQIYDHTGIGFRRLPRTEQLLYEKGYDRVRRQRDADFSIDITLAAGVRDNPDVRAGHAVGGALAGAAAGAIIGGALGDPGPGAAIGAASGGLLGLAAPAATTVVRIDVNIRSLRDGESSFASSTVDLAHVPPPQAFHVIDAEIARMLQSLPRR